jgi:hypothetical protein
MCRVTARKLFMNLLKIQSIYTNNITWELKNISVVLSETCFLALLKNCKNVVASLHYNNQAAAVVDYIISTLKNFLSVILYGQVLLFIVFFVRKFLFGSFASQEIKKMLKNTFFFFYLQKIFCI